MCIGNYNILVGGDWNMTFIGGDWNMTFIHPYIENFIIPIDVPIFQRG